MEEHAKGGGVISTWYGLGLPFLRTLLIMCHVVRSARADMVLDVCQLESTQVSCGSLWKASVGFFGRQVWGSLEGKCVVSSGHL